MQAKQHISLTSTGSKTGDSRTETIEDQTQSGRITFDGKSLTRRMRFAVFLCGVAMIPVARAQNTWDWWPDPATHRGISTWISFSTEYDTLWSDRARVDQEVASIAQSGVEVVFLSVSSSATRPDLQRLADRTDPFTSDVQYALNSLGSSNVRACASILSDYFTGSDTQMQSFVLVDPLLAFNASRGPSDSGFTCVATDLEIPNATQQPPGYRNSAVYDLWKQFHGNMQSRIAAAGGGLRLLAWMQGPDYLISTMADPADRDQLMQREGITQDPADTSLYDGALRYFTTQAGAPIFDAVIPMWYFTPSSPYYRRVDHNFAELQALGIQNLYLIPGVMIRNSGGLCCPGCVNGREDYDARLGYNDSLRLQLSGLIGTGVFKWPIPPDWTCPL